ncbi:class I SAM-dependent methyltransferase [Marinigracilibium pacificum]|uniref:Class I SAM-dependent methyltransferase n=1 Tax=Marinigracilibium pacificum TaxID=2729599 RepID=A0A848J1G2_9BACT|nr:class I SAM-dependent methyltransferase [Marinigracilibium pacificum]NMM49355.1 class I SAM-dependent methyltransferase [Marinigracilibium pacificum]
MSAYKKYDVHGKALLDYYNEKQQGPLIIHNYYGDPEEMPLIHYFKDFEDFTSIEQEALLESTREKILDIGAAAGTHALFLQSKGYDITALDTSEFCCEVMKKRGVQKVECADFFHYQSKEKYDTLLLLMNGIGFIGEVKKFKDFLKKADELSTDDGIIIFDSSDITYLYDETDLKVEGYFGEVDYQYEYNGEKGEWFKWLYLDYDKLKSLAKQSGWKVTMIDEDSETGHYLVKLEKQ